MYRVYVVVLGVCVRVWWWCVCSIIGVLCGVCMCFIDVCVYWQWWCVLAVVCVCWQW